MRRDRVQIGQRTSYYGQELYGWKRRKHLSQSLFVGSKTYGRYQIPMCTAEREILLENLAGYRVKQFSASRK
jgi:hypothetical protein